MRRRVLGAGMAALGLIAASLAWPALAAPRIGQIAPNFEVTTLDGQTVTLAALRGQVVVLNFWATWCAPCKVELPLLDRFYRRRKSDGLAVLAVTTQDSLPLRTLKPVAKALAFPMVRSIRGPYATMGAVPTNYVIDRSGVLRYARAGAFSEPDLDAILGPLLDEPSPAPTSPATVAAAEAMRLAAR
jgi:peroxiredoxin